VTAPPVIRTVLGDIAPNDAGDVNYHEHLFQVSPLLAGDELNDVDRSREEAAALAGSGTSLMIEATPTGLGARPADVAQISSATGLSIVHATGLHHGGHYPEDHPVRALSIPELADLFTADITFGFTAAGEVIEGPAGPVRAGVIKAGIRYWSIGLFERQALSAVAEAHDRTGAPVMVHLDYGSAAHEVLDVLAGLGVGEASVVLAHMDRNLDPGLHLDLIARGARLGYDGWARHREAPDSAIIDCAASVVEGSCGERGIVLGGDVARASRYVSYGGVPGLAYVNTRVVPRLRERLGDGAVDRILHDNPADLLSFVPR